MFGLDVANIVVSQPFKSIYLANCVEEPVNSADGFQDQYLLRLDSKRTVLQRKSLALKSVLQSLKLWRKTGGLALWRWTLDPRGTKRAFGAFDVIRLREHK